MRAPIVIAAMLLLAGCTSGAQQTDAKTASRIERRTQRFLDRAEGNGGTGVRTYIERAYCGPFARKGWVYADGALSIKAHVWLLNGYSCSSLTATPDGTTITVPCDARAEHLDPLECGILHNVRRDEVRTYLRKLKRSQSVKCDDGTPLDELGIDLQS